MSYLNYPRIHFSGTFKASPSTINNTPNNYDPLIYPSPNALDKVELYWNPRGDGGFGFEEDCVITQVDYEDGTSATSSSEDSIIGQPIKAIHKASFPCNQPLLISTPCNRTFLKYGPWYFQIGDSEANLTGNVPNVAFNGIWVQCQGPTAPPSSASGSAVFQVRMSNVVQTGDSSNSRFFAIL